MEFAELSDAQWKRLSTVIPPLPRRSDNRGRPWNAPRQVLNGIIWVLENKKPWSSLDPDRYPPFQTCHRWYQRWLDDGTLHKIAHLLSTEASMNTAEWFKEGKIVAVRQRFRKKPSPKLDISFDISSSSFKKAA